MKSSIFRFFANMFHTLAIWFDASLVGRAFNAVADFCMRTFRHSILGRLFSSEAIGKVCGESFFAKLPTLIIHLIRTITGPFRSFCLNTAGTSKLVWLFSNWNAVSIRLYGVSLAFFSVFYTVFRLLWRNPSTLEHCAVGILFICAIAAIIINRSIKSLFKGSVILTAFGGLFCEIRKDSDSKLFLKDPEFFLSRPLVGLLIGFVSALFASFLPPFAVLLSVASFAFICLVLIYPAFGVFTVIMASPFLPTMVLVGLCMLCICSFLLQLAFKESFSWRPVPMAGFIIVFALAMALGTVNSFSPLKSLLILLIYLVFMMFYFVAYQTLDTPRKWRAAVVAFLMMAGFVALYGIYQNFAGVDSTQSWVDSNMFEDIKIRVYSTFDNPNVLGEYLVLLIPISLAVIWKSNTDGKKLLYVCLAAVLGLCLIFTWSRGAWLGVMLAVFLYLVIADKRWALLAVLGVVALPFLLSTGSAVADRIMSIGNTADTSTAYRVSIWRASVMMIKDIWLSGIGLGSDAFAEVYKHYALSGADFALHAHNLFLQICVESGIFGIGSFLVMMLAFFKNCFSLTVFQNRTRVDCALCMAMAAGVLGFLLQGLTDNVWYNYKMVLIFWIMMTLASSAAAPDFDGGEHL